VAAHGYGALTVCLFAQLVLEAGVSLRGASRVIETVSQVLGLGLAAPHWTSGRGWVLRLGHAILTAAKPAADDWAWLVDHSVQIGQEKCLAVLGVRLSDLPPRGQCLRHQDMELIDLAPGKSWTAAQVDASLEKAAGAAGHVPRVIVDDHGGDLHGGVELFRRRHRQTAEIYDIKHKAACLLRKLLEDDPRWRAFVGGVGQSRCCVQQTELAYLTPPAPKLKARFMNLGGQLAWARRVLAILRQSPSAGRLQQKLGWIADFEGELAQWSQWQQVIDVAVKWVNTHGIYRGVSGQLKRQLAQLGGLGDSARELAARLCDFVTAQESQARPRERLAGSTEILESCFGKFKHLEKQQSSGGFTQLLLGFGAQLARLTPQSVREMLRASRTKDVVQWARQNLGTTLFAQRKLAFAGATESG
jgi:hypothetical protein